MPLSLTLPVNLPVKTEQTEAAAMLQRNFLGKAQMSGSISSTQLFKSIKTDTKRIDYVPPCEIE